MKNIFCFIIITAFISAIISCKKSDDTTPSTFTGTWHVTSNHTITTQQHWDMTIVAGSSASEILLDNFDQIGNTNHVTATVSGSSFTIPQQTVSSTVFKGTGSLSNGNLSFNYTADDGVRIDTVSATAHK